jgi:hypothetical protein
MRKLNTSIEGELYGVPVSIPVVVEYEYNKAIPAGPYSPREPAHVRVTSIRVREGLTTMHAAPYLNPYRRLLEDQILHEIREEEAA